ncbi:MAG TPA: hypothetical protein VFQ76_07980 [Longimicrobiaceae bacterium]|nr:hypothetical protein [Longimicrobiaceae bacterium]
MLRLFRLLLPGMVWLGLAGCAAPDRPPLPGPWTLVFENAEIRIALDTSRVLREPGQEWAWLRMEYGSPEPIPGAAGTFDVSESLVGLRCERREMQINRMLLFDGSGSLIEESQTGGAWRDPSELRFDEVFDRTCSALAERRRTGGAG